MKLLRTIRLDPSDTFIFERAAEPGEWAVPGTFRFAAMDVASLEGRGALGLRAGFLGIDSLGWSTLVQVVEATEQDRAAALELLARRLIEHFGAPDIAIARAAAEEEIAFAASISIHTEGMVVALTRRLEGGDIRESFRTLAPGVATNLDRVFAFVEDTGVVEEPVKEVDLLGLAKEGAGEPSQ